MLESDFSTSSDGDRGQRRERLTERKKLHQMKRDHEQQESTKRKVLKLDEGQDEFSSGSDTEKKGRGKKDKRGSGSNVDIQVNSFKSFFLHYVRYLLLYPSAIKVVPCMFEVDTSVLDSSL